MWTNNTLYIAFIAQVLFASWYMPRMILSQTKNILEKYPASQYPKLYPVSSDVYLLKMEGFKRFNYFNIAVGLFIVLFGTIYQSEEMLNIDSSAVLLGFFLLQYLPFFLMEMSGFKYLKLMRIANENSTRKANLTPRYFLRDIPKTYKIIFLVSHLLFISTVEYFIRNPFDGFGGYENLLVLLFIDLFMLSLYAWNVYGKRKDPHLSNADRAHHNQKIARTVVLTIALVVLFTMLQLIMSATETRHHFDSLLCVYFLILTAISLGSYRIDNVNFEVYRAG